MELRIGRITFDLGRRRLVARNRFRNTVNSFAGVDWAWQAADGRALRVFYVAPMRHLPGDRPALLANAHDLDRIDRGTELFGAFYGLRADAGRAAVEIYALELDVDESSPAGSARADLTTLGSRAYRTRQRGWNFELEPIVQFGDSVGFADGDANLPSTHRAYFLHVDVGYAFGGLRSTVVRLDLDYASGDERPDDGSHERFNTLFGARRFDLGPSGIYGAFARNNLESAGVRANFSPSQRLDAMVSYRSMRLASARDAWTAARLRDTGGAAGKSLGRQLEASVSWEALPERLEIESGFAYLAAGRFARAAPGSTAGAHVAYVYFGLTAFF